MGERHHVLLGVSGSVAAIKLPELVAALQAHGDVRVVLTSAGKRLARTQCDPAACAEHVYDDETEWTAWQKVGDQVLHIALREWADVLVIAPLSANTMAKLAHGLADSLLAAIARAWDFDKPMVLCPAMNTCMWEHPVTAQQLDTLRSFGAAIVAPVEKKLACGDTGIGALASPQDIAAAVGDALRTSDPPK